MGQTSQPDRDSATGVSIQLQLRWGDQDLYGHVNNALIVKVLEEARVRAVLQFAPEFAQVPVVVARQEIEYTNVLQYSVEPIEVIIHVCRIGTSGFDYSYQLIDPAGTTCVIAESSQVLIDATTGRPTQITDRMRSTLETVAGPRAPFRRRVKGEN